MLSFFSKIMFFDVLCHFSQPSNKALKTKSRRDFLCDLVEPYGGQNGTKVDFDLISVRQLMQ